MAEGYVMDLRKKIGHVPMVIACASLIIYDENRGILLQKRADNVIMVGQLNRMKRLKKQRNVNSMKKLA